MRRRLNPPPATPASSPLTMRVNNADIRYQRAATNPRNLAVEPTARDKIKAAFATPEKSQLSPKVGALDTPLRVALEKTKALNVWRAAFNLTEMLGGYAATGSRQT